MLEARRRSHIATGLVDVVLLHDSFLLTILADRYSLVPIDFPLIHSEAEENSVGYTHNVLLAIKTPRYLLEMRK